MSLLGVNLVDAVNLMVPVLEESKLAEDGREMIGAELSCSGGGMGIVRTGFVCRLTLSR